jgi:hypothetical protein
MQELREVALRSSAIRGFVTEPPELLSPKYVQGVNLSIDPFWLAFWRWKHGGRDGRRIRERRLFERLPLMWSDKPAGWKEYCLDRGYPEDAHPITIVVILREPPERTYLARLPKRLEDFPIRYECEPECVAVAGNKALRPGETVGPKGLQSGDHTSEADVLKGSKGTVGGFLRNYTNGSVHATTCAHVAGSVPNRIYRFRPPMSKPVMLIGELLSHGKEGWEQFPVGYVRTTSIPPQLEPAGKCNRLHNLDAGEHSGGPPPIQKNALDFALIELEENISATPLIDGLGLPNHSSKISDLTPGDSVKFVGATSGCVEAVLGDMNIWRDIRVEGERRCFGDLFTMEHPHHIYVQSSLVRPGDSGAWVVNSDADVLCWDGMVIAEAGARAYCCYAAHILSACRTGPERDFGLML